ncbi:ribosome hibernation-promoting factor, HPF/YfiA family [Oceanisphaera pacifica]|uniref:Ribosome-associated translation inhibitor RaiA n=1 Tax=Oceanisphaera pacifica TaxID=2818389 RepID=A0ABS3NHD8_9GAMM|nr:ribosome-associated translation inhibitor RaiA [Oceanisphaera pacifica]MBO1519813.1 ribosome-associated translation inhibitor RaiA [Oceanisphaera pacifica]
MSITITSTTIDISPAIRERIESRFAKLSRRQVDLITPQVIINKEGLKHQVEATVGVRHDTLFAKAEDDNLYAAIKDLGQKLERQLNRYADKPVAKRAQAGQPIGPSDVDDSHLDAEIDDEEASTL